MERQHSNKKREYETDKVVVPIRPLAVVEEVERKMEIISPNGWFPPLQKDLPMLSDELLRMDLIDRNDEVMIRVEIPGIKKGDLEASLTDRTVTIRGIIRTEEKGGGGEYYRHEICTRTFRRTDTLPAIVDDSNVRAAFKDGILEISAPKLERALQHPVRID